MTRQEKREYSMLFKETKNIENQLKNTDYSKNIENYYSLLQRLRIIESNINTISEQERKNRGNLMKSQTFMESMGFYRS